MPRDDRGRACERRPFGAGAQTMEQHDRPDGRRTWQALTATVPDGMKQITVAGPVGWMVGSHTFSFTMDGGTRCLARLLRAAPAGHRELDDVLTGRFVVPDRGSTFVG